MVRVLLTTHSGTDGVLSCSSMRRKDLNHGAAKGVGEAALPWKVIRGVYYSGYQHDSQQHFGINIKRLLFLTLSLLIFGQTNAQSSKGARCVTATNENGICTPIEECTNVKELLDQGIRPKICSFDLNIPIVCCATRSVKPSRPTPKPSRVTTPRNKPRPTPARPRPRKSISDRKCEEYSKLVTKRVQAVPLVVDPNPLSIKVEDCPQAGLELIVGGQPTGPQEYPHMAAIGFAKRGEPGYDWNCGGSLISDYYVLTAAHCTANSNGPAAVIRMGELKLGRGDAGAELFRPPGYSKQKGGASIGDYRISSILRHPDYRPPAKYNDIALIKLEKPVKPFTPLVRPACLYSKPTFTTNRTIATGWGRIDFAEDLSDILLKVSLQIYDNNKCNELYSLDKSTGKLSQGIVSSMMCAGDPKGGKDTCQGDSGGPIQIQDPNNRCIHYIIGVTSFGKFCAAPNTPGVYTRVSSYIQWIESVVWS